MSHYPFEGCRVLQDGFRNDSDDGIRTYRSINGDHKTHVMYDRTAYVITMRHFLAGDEYKQLMDFYQANKGKLFNLTLPDEDVGVEARFMQRPKIVRCIGEADKIVEVVLAANSIIGSV